jgi:transcriptional regulator with XRE-family HTH domain
MTKAPNETDIVVGTRVRVRRKALGLSQGKLGEELGITFQQVQKYEKGTNRIGASRLLAIAEALGVPVSYFFPDPGNGDAAAAPDELYELMGAPGAVELLRDYVLIQDSAVRRSINTLVRELAKSARQTATASRRN